MSTFEIVWVNTEDNTLNKTIVEESLQEAISEAKKKSLPGESVRVFDKSTNGLVFSWKNKEEW